MNSNSIWIITIASLVGISCSLVGVFLVLRKMAMIGDAISHSVLFGLVIGFLISGSRSPLIMFISAACCGVLTAFVTSFLHRRGKLQEDASIGVTFTSFFAVGIILISLFAGQIDLDQDCVLHGEIAFAPLQTIFIAGTDVGPRAFWILIAVTLANILFLIIGRREMTLLTFDSLFAHSVGINIAFWHYLLMGMVSLTTVASFESVGAILVVAMLVIPPATAYLWCRSIRAMLAISVAISILSAFGGYYLAVFYDASISAAMVIVAMMLFVISLIIQELQRYLKHHQAQHQTHLNA